MRPPGARGPPREPWSTKHHWEWSQSAVGHGEQVPLDMCSTNLKSEVGGLLVRSLVPYTGGPLQGYLNAPQITNNRTWSPKPSNIASTFSPFLREPVAKLNPKGGSGPTFQKFVHTVNTPLTAEERRMNRCASHSRYKSSCVSICKGIQFRPAFHNWKPHCHLQDIPRGWHLKNHVNVGHGMRLEG